MARFTQRMIGEYLNELGCDVAGGGGIPARLPSLASDVATRRNARIRDSAEYGLDALAEAIETQIVPRLLLARRAQDGVESVAAGVGEQPTADDIEELSRLLVANDDTLACRFVELLRERGMLPESIYVRLFAPAARRLGELWEDDTRSFAEVTLGLWRLHALMHDLSPDFLGGASRRASSHRGLFVPYPGEQHCFGVFMVAEFFRRAGWDVWSGPPATVDDLVGLVSSEFFDVVGLSLASERLLDKMAATIRTLRRKSRNPDVAIMVGGAVFSGDKAVLAERIGADATAVDGPKSVRQAESMLAMLRPGT